MLLIFSVSPQAIPKEEIVNILVIRYGDVVLCMVFLFHVENTQYGFLMEKFQALVNTDK